MLVVGCTIQVCVTEILSVIAIYCDCY